MPADENIFAAYEAATTDEAQLREANKLLLKACKEILPFVSEDFRPGYAERTAAYQAAHDQLRSVVKYATGEETRRYARLICGAHGAIDISETEYDRQLSRPNARWSCPRCGDVCAFDDEYFEERNLSSEETVS
jgi:rubrerythrin